MADNSQKLPQREAGVFKKIVRCYECKQYKNGLKFCRQILSNPKLSEHGETLAMKGLILNCMGRKEEAYDHVRRGLKNDIKSHVCWHVYGLLQRSDKKYEEAIKCYRNALKWDHENVQILRDLSLLQIQMRDIEGFRDTRYQLLKARPAQRSSWVGYALSYHLIKDYTMSLKVMEEYRKTQVPGLTKPDYEFNEMVLYESQLLLESGRPDEALKHLQAFEQYICDLLTYWKTKAEILYTLDRLSEAECLYRELIHRNPENYFYFDQLEKCLLLEGGEGRLQLYVSLQDIYRRSHSVRRIPLKFTTGDTFANLVDKYLRKGLHKGMHSLFMSIRNLYSDPMKVQVIGDLVAGYVQSIRTCGHFLPKESGPAEPPTSYLWSLYLSAQHYNRIGQSLKALELIDAAIEHTPTEVQLYMMKAKILKHAGDIEQAAVFMNEARTLDTADRFVNCKCAKYYLRSSAIDTAIETAALFTREGLPPLQTMDEMQCIWFQLEMARACHRLGKLGGALQKLHEIDQHFVDIIDDQFDFHTYCMRKMTLRAYIGVLKLEDKLRDHPFYTACARLAIEIYVYLHDNPSAKSAKLNGPAAPEEQLSASELKKLQRKQKKAQLKAQAAKAAEEKTKDHKAHGKGGGGEEDKKVEEREPKFDPDKLLQTDKPLEEAVKFLVPLQTLSPGNVVTHTLAYEIHFRRRRFLLMLQALKRLHAIDPDDGDFHRILVDFVLTVETTRASLPGPVLEVITGTLPRLTGGLELTQLNQRFLDKHQHSLPHLVPGCRALYRLHPDAKERALSCICSLSDKLRGRTLKRCIEIHSLLQSGEFGDCSDHIISFARSCSAFFPLATTFKPTEPPDKQKVESRNEPLACNSIDQDLSSATEQRLNLD